MTMSAIPYYLQAPEENPLMAAPPLASGMGPVDPHATLTAPIGPPAPEPMALDTKGASEPKMAAKSEPVSEPKMSPLSAQKEHINKNLMADYAKDENPYGSAENHPGFFGKLLHGLSHATGGDTRRSWEEQGLEHRLQDIGKHESEEGLQEAQTTGKNLENENEPQKAADTHAEAGARTENLKSETDARRQAAAEGPSLATAYAHAVNEALKANRDPAQDPIVQHLSDAITSIQKQTAPKGAHFIQREIGGKPHTIAVDDLTGADIRDEGETGEKPPVVNVNAETSALDRESARFAKGHEKSLSDAQSQLEKIADARTMVNGSAEAQALGVPKVLTALVSGQGSGVRITLPELNAIARARGITGDIEGTLQSWAGEGKLTPTQRQQLTGLLDDVKNRIMQKAAIHNEALDAINGARSREDIIAADKTAREKLSKLEAGGAKETREYGGATYEKGDDGQWHKQVKASK